MEVREGPGRVRRQRERTREEGVAGGTTARRAAKTTNRQHLPEPCETGRVSRPGTELPNQNLELIEISR